MPCRLAERLPSNVHQNHTFFPPSEKNLQLSLLVDRAVGDIPGRGLVVGVGARGLVDDDFGLFEVWTAAARAA